MIGVELAHGSRDFARILQRLNGLTYLGPDLRADRVRSAQILIVSAGIDRSHYGKHRFAGVERYFWRLLAQRRGNQCGKQGRTDRLYQPTAQGILLRTWRDFEGSGSQCRALARDGSTLAVTMRPARVGPESSSSQPFTLIFENESTARPEVGRPMVVAGRNVVKISMFFTLGNRTADSLESERMR